MANHLRWISPLAIVALWQLASVTGVLPETTLQSPSTIATTAWDLVGNRRTAQVQASTRARTTGSLTGAGGGSAR